MVSICLHCMGCWSEKAKDSNDDRTFLKLELPSELHVDTNWLFF